MATIIDNEDHHDHRVTVLGDAGMVQIVLVGKGPTAFLWVGDNDDRHLATITGEEVLRVLAKAILKEVGDK